MNNIEHIETALDIVLESLNEDIGHQYKGFYESFRNKKLIKIFSIYHSGLNKLLKYLNTRLNSKHYTANESRELLKLIESIAEVENLLKETEFEFQIKEYYKDVLSKCNKFLQNSGGSTIPIEFRAVNIIDLEPIFFLKKSNYVKKDNKFFKLKSIGGGSYADVYKYKDSFYNKNFAIKRAKKDLKDDEYKRFVIEFEELKKFKSPYIVEVYRFDEEKSEYIMEYMDMTLEEYIIKYNSKLNINERKNIVYQIIKAFKYIHSQGILHRDISTKNILVNLYDDVVVIKVSDFGLVKLDTSELTRKGTEIKGSLNDHQNLEIVGFDKYDKKFETYALTKLIYFVMTGRLSLEKYNKTKYKDFVSKGISNEMNERYSSVEELETHFRNLAH